MLDLELNPSCQESCAFQQTADHWIDAVFQNPTQALSNAGILIREFARLLVKQLKFPIVEIEKFPVHQRFTIGLR